MPINLETDVMIAGIEYQSRSVATKERSAHACLICECPIERGEEYAMVPTRPLTAAEEEKMERGEEFVAWHEPTHWVCLLVRTATCAGFMRKRAEA